MIGEQAYAGEEVVAGAATGRLLVADVGLSFMGGVDPATGVVVDTHHPLRGRSIAGTILAIPSGRGSCAGSLTLFELLMNGHAPAALIFRHSETILTLGDIIALELFGRGIPIVRLPAEAFAALANGRQARVVGATVIVSSVPFDVRDGDASMATAQLPALDVGGFDLAPRDRRLLAGDFGEAAAVALRIIIRAAKLEGGTGLVDVERAHIDGCFYEGPGTLLFARRLRQLGARVAVPSTMNSLCVDRRRWRDQGVGEALGVPSDELADVHVEMGVRPTYTCAPYLLDDAPAYGEQIAWGESNAVVFANSVLGARTLKYPDYLDLLVAITGRAPLAGCHLPSPRQATLRIDVPRPRKPDDAYFALLGYHVRMLATNEIPVICGLESVPATRDDLKAFGAAFATMSAAPMFHILGRTPEAGTLEDAAGPAGPQRAVTVAREELEGTWRSLTTATTPDVDLVSLGNPHFSLTEIAALAERCVGRRKAKGIALIVTCGRDVQAKAEAAGYVATVEAFGGQFVNDTCWCLIREPVIPPWVRTIATNSGKYAHYGPAALPHGFHFASLKRCVDAACTGRINTLPPAWLRA